MKKDIFIDNNVASKFSNPQDKEYVKLTQWLLKYSTNDNENKNAYLVVSQKLLREYYASAQGAKSDNSIPMIIGRLQAESRLIVISNQQIKDFQKKYFTKVVEKRLMSNHEDREHIPVVLLSDRKYALSYDKNFKADLEGFAGFTVRVEKRPEDLPYNE